jgi:hypothetical protein
MMRRVALAALAGALAAGLWLLLVAGVMLWVDRGPCDTETFECLGQGIVGLLASFPLALGAAWLILHLLGIRPAWKPALLALPILAVLGFVAYQTVFQSAPQVTAVVVAAVSYALAVGLSLRD